MSWGANEPRVAARQIAAARAAGIAIALVLCPNAALADIVRFKPTVTLEQVFTDNVRASSDDRDPDAITVLTLDVDAKVQTARLNMVGAFTIGYEEFWANDFDNLHGEGVAAGRFEVLDRTLYLDGLAEKTQVFLSPDEGSISGLARSKLGAREVESYSGGPFLTMDLLGLLDLRARATWGEVLFNDPIPGPTIPLRDLSFTKYAGNVTTGERSTRYEAIVNAEHIETDLGFEMDNTVGSLFLHLTKGFTAIGRIGYEQIVDPLFAPIDGNIWSLGGRYRTGTRLSFFEFEYGRRYDDESYAGKMRLQLTPLLRFVSSYTDSLNPIQFTLVRSLDDLFNEDGVLSAGIPQGPGLPNPLVVDTIVRDKDLDFTGRYLLGYREYALSFLHADRFYPSIADHEKMLYLKLSARERLSSRLSYEASLEYDDRYDTILGFQQSKSYLADLSFAYRYNDAMRFSAGYQFGLRTPEEGGDILENVLRFGVSIPAGDEPSFVQD